MREGSDPKLGCFGNQQQAKLLQKPDAETLGA